MRNDSVSYAFRTLLKEIEQQKPNDRSSRDRAYAIVKTEVEKALAYYWVWAAVDSDGET